LLRLGKEFHNRRFPFSVLHFDEGESFRSECFRNRGQLIDLADGNTGEIFGIDGLDHTALGQRALEKLELAAAKYIAEIDQTHAKTAIRFVAPNGIDGFAVSQPWKR